jgi:hypothetical protein
MLALLLASLWQATGPGPRPPCPSVEALFAELDRLGTTDAVAKIGTPEVEVEGATMRVSLRASDGSISGIREVAAPDDCQERATVAATLISAWVGAFPTDGFPENDSPAAGRHAMGSGTDPKTTAPGLSPARPPVPASTTEKRQPLPTVSQALPSTTPREKAVPPEPAANPPKIGLASKSIAGRRGLGLEIAGLAFAAHDGDSAALGGAAEMGLLLPGWAVLAALFETTLQRERRLDPAVATYRTYRGGLGLGARHRWPHVLGEVSLFPEVTLMKIDGRLLGESRQVTTWGAAGELHARIGLLVGRFFPFLCAGASYALRAQRLTLEGAPNHITLSRWDLILGVGVALRFDLKDSR